jgi:hypothetical protein
MKAKFIRMVAPHESSMGSAVPQTRAAASACLRRAICAAGLTQEQAGRLIGVEGRQVRRWLAKAPDVLVLLVELERLGQRRAA